MDYNRNECQSVTTSSEDNLFNLRLSTGIAFFEAICLRGERDICCFFSFICIESKHFDFVFLHISTFSRWQSLYQIVCMLSAEPTKSYCLCRRKFFGKSSLCKICVNTVNINNEINPA